VLRLGAASGSLHGAGYKRVKRIQRIEMMAVLVSILWAIGLTFLIIGIVLLVAGKNRHAWRHRYRHI